MSDSSYISDSSQSLNSDTDRYSSDSEEGTQSDDDSPDDDSPDDDSPERGSRQGRGDLQVGDVTVSITTGSPYEQSVDVVVNSCSKDLDLTKGRSSSALLKAAGQSVQIECNKKYSSGVGFGDIAVTNGGKLSCSKIFHCAIPSYSGKAEEKILSRVVSKCLEEADKRQYTTLALPPLGSGYAKYPPATIAEIMLDEIENFSASNLDTVNIVIFHRDQATLQEFQRTFQKKSSKGKASPKGARSRTKGISSTANGSGGSQTFSHFTVDVQPGDLTTAKTDVIVFTAPNDLNLSNGALSISVQNAAGANFQRDLKSDYPWGVSYGEVAHVKGYNLNCRKVFIGALPAWGTKSPNPESVLYDFVERCLEEANEHNLKRMAFSTLGIGAPGYPYDRAAKAMIGSMGKFDRRFSSPKIQSVSILIYHQHPDYNKIKAAFDNELQSVPASTGPGISKYPTAVVSRGSCSKSFGSTQVNVLVDNMTSQKVDVIVNSVSPKLQLKSSSGLALSILNHGGKEIQKELDKKYSKGISIGEIAKTSGGKLSCKRIYHGTLPYWYSKKKHNKKPEEVIETFVYDCLSMAANDGYSSIAFPVLGTGYQKFPPDVSAHHLIMGIEKYTKKHKSIREVRIVIYGGSSDYQAAEKAFKNEFSGRSTAVPAQTKGSAPQRGTTEFFRLMYMQEARPPSTWSQFTNKRTIRDWSINLSASLSPMQEVQPDPTTVQSIQKAFLSTIGSKPHIFSITRIENIDLFQKYMDECQRLFKKAYANKKSFDAIQSLAHSSKKNVALEKYLHKGMTSQLYPEINEHYFFHGTNASVVPVIKSQGLDSRLASSGRVGAGVYGAEVASKSAQYVGPDQKGHCFMFIIRMCMGDVHVTKTGGNYRRAPCKTCFSDKCIKHYDLYDSIMADGGAFSDREFLVYDKNQCYPEYLIEFSSQMQAPKMQIQVPPMPMQVPQMQMQAPQMPLQYPAHLSSALGLLQNLQN